MRMLLLGALLCGLAVPALADPPILVDPETGKYLGNLGSPLDPDSVNNPVGIYGSPVSPDSINNPVGIYGSPVSPNSPSNPLATNPPVLRDPDTGKFLGNLGPPLDPDSIHNPVGVYGSPLSPDSVNNPLGVYGSPYSSQSPNNIFDKSPTSIGPSEPISPVCVLGC